MTLKPCWASRKQETQQPLSCWVSWDILVESGGIEPPNNHQLARLST